jgi:MazG family protein
MNKTVEKFSELIDIMYKLRRECPWDREQTPESLRQFVLEETYEVLEAIDKQKWDSLAKELGDLLLQIVFQAVIAEEENRFNLHDIISNINHKMIERHPHVFANVSVNGARDVKQNWEHIKVKSENRKSLLSGIPKETPALLRAQRLQEKASHVGFDWENPEDVFGKIKEELAELKNAVAKNDKEHVAEEMGDLLFSLVNYARFLGLVAEDSLRITNEKFISRFEKIEKHYGQDYDKIKSASLTELDKIWNEAKKQDDNK